MGSTTSTGWILRGSWLAAAVLALAACVSKDPPAPREDIGAVSSAVFANGGFETGAANAVPPPPWVLTDYLNPNPNGVTVQTPQTLAGLNLVTQGAACVTNANCVGANFGTCQGGFCRPSSKTITLASAAGPGTQIDPNLGPAASLRWPRYGKQCALVNQLGNLSNANQLSQTMTVGAADVDPTDGKVHVRLVVAPVLEDPGHLPNQQPYFFVQVTNVTQANAVLYTNFNFSNQAGVPWQTATGGGNTYRYTNWQLIDVSPGAPAINMGDQLELQIIASGCSIGGHWGQVYVDGVGSTIPGLFVSGAGPAQSNSGTNITYTLTSKNGSAPNACATSANCPSVTEACVGGFCAETGVVLDFTTPPNTTFQSLAPPPGATCTTPAVGTAGTIVCTFTGPLSPGASASASVTVAIAAGATGSIVAGNYQIGSTQETPLLGNKITTLLTTADLSITKSDGVASVAWGETGVTYAIKASNAGPMAVTGATVADTIPPQLTGATWTCVGSGGGACTASGTGNINDSLVNLPVGASVTYTLTANVIAGAGAGSVTNTATIGEVGITDPNLANDTASDTDTISTGDTLTVTKNAPQAGTITSAPGGISCGTACTSESAAFVNGSAVTLTMVPAAGWTFVGWTGACASAGAATTCDLTLSGATAVGATFIGPPSSVTVSAGGTQSTNVNTAFPTPLTVLVTDAVGDPLPGVLVTYAVPGSGASAVLGSPTATTNASGLANVLAKANTTPGSYGVTASVAGVVTAASFALTNLAGPAATIIASGGTPQTTTVGLAFATPLQVTVADAFGNPVSGATVTYLAPGPGGPSAGLSAPATTDAAGKTQVTALANTVSGAYAVTASVVGAASPASFALANLPGAPASIVATTGSGQTATVSTVFGAPLVVTVLDAFGNPIPGVTVTFTDPGAGASAGLSAAPTTNASGQSSVTATANAASGTYTVTATVGGLSANFTLTNAPGGPATVTVSSGSGQSTTVGTPFGAPLVALVKDSKGNVVPGVAVTFSPPGSSASAVIGGSPATTNGFGLATVSASANTVAGSYTVTASVPGATPASFSLTNLAGSAATIKVSAGSGQSTTVGTSFGAPLAALVQDASGNPVPNAIVTFTPPASGASASLTGSPATTNASGIASVTALANTAAGAYAVTASVPGASAPASFSLTNTAGAPASIAVASGSNQSTAVTTAFGAPLVALVSDASGNPVPGIAVTFTPPGAGSGASATITGSPATTNAAGLASVTATANGVAGAFAVSASAPGVSSPASFALTNNAGQATQITVVSGSGQQTTVAQPFAAPLVALVRDASNNPVAGAQVALRAPSSGASASLSTMLAVSDAAGHVSVTAVSGTVAGAFSVTASLQGVATPATFALTSVAGPAVAILAAPGSTPQSTAVSTPFPVALGVTVVDAYGNPVPGVTVTFAPPGSAPTASLGATTGVTDATGATSVTATAGPTPGVYVVTATLPNGTEVNFTLTNVATPPDTITVSSGAPASVVVGTAFAAPLVALVKDGSGNPLANALVAFTDPTSGATAQLAAPTALTDASGLAQVAATASDKTGAYSVVATVAGAASPALFKITNTPGAPASISAAPSSTPQSTQVGTAFPAPLIVTVLDAFGNPIPGVTVGFTVPSSGASATLGAVFTTDANGQVSVLATANATAGSYSITASVAGVSAPATFQLTNLATAPNTIQVKSGSAQSTVVATAFGAPLVALVLDPTGNPVPGVTVTFTPPAAAPNALLGTASATTNASGLAQTTATASNLAGQYNVVATIVGGATPAVFALTNAPGAPTTVTASASSTPQSALVGTVYGEPLIVTVADTFGNGVPGISVQYAPPASGASVSLAATLPTTSSNGQTSVVAIANGTAGAFTVTATVSGIATPASFALTNTASAPSTLVVTSGGGQSTEATTAFPSPIVLDARDSFGNAVSGAVIAVTLPAAGASATFTPPTPTTDSTGSVSIQLTANAHVGTFAASFSVAGGSSPASVNLTNTAIPTTTVLTASTTTPVEGASITLTAGVSSAIGTPGGTVTFFAGSTQLGQATLSAGTAVLTVPAPAAGAYAVTAVYGGVDPYAPSTSNAIALTVSSTDAGAPDGGGNDAGVDAGNDDSGAPDAGAPDEGIPDAGGIDSAATPDASEADGASTSDAGSPNDAGGPGGTIQGGGCTCTNAGGAPGAPPGTGILVGLALAAVTVRASRSRARRRARR